MPRDPADRRVWLTAAIALLLLNTAYLAAAASPTIFYFSNVVLHIGLGLVMAFVLARAYYRRRDQIPPLLQVFVVLLAAGTLAGAAIVVVGAYGGHRWLRPAHIALSLAGAAPLLVYAAARIRGRLTDARRLAFAVMCVIVGAASAAAVVAAAQYGESRRARYRIVNPLTPPLSMEQEGAGPRSPFFPSSSDTNVHRTIPANFFMTSQTCGRCHSEIYNEWKSSVHHFASFNNQFYRKSIEYMQDTVGTQPSKWCAGCHDHAVFFNGRFDRPIKEQIDTPEAHAGLACTSCHSIVHVNSTMGNADFTIEYPPLHELATSRNKYVHALDYFLTFLNPGPHKSSFLKPFMRGESAEFCAACHKVHLDVPVNKYRWFRGFNDYDNWQASGVSGQGARSFYYPPKSQVFADCHMPLVASRDPGNHQGMVHSHRFPAANTAIAYANRDEAQMKATEQFLKSGFITVDIFAVSPVENKGTEMVRRTGDAPQAMSGFAVGEESEAPSTGVIREVGQIAAPIDHAGTKLQPGSTARVDVVVRTRKIGHFFRAGTVDAFDVWLELEGKDASGRVIFWSGRVEDDGRGPVEPGAHFYRSYQLDGAGNQINKRNAWQSRSVLYVRLIPPGAADVAHYRVKIPKDAKGPVTLTAKLNSRKFSRYYTEFAYAGQPVPGQDPSKIDKHFNSLEYSFAKSNIPSNVSGQVKGEIPSLPITTLAK